MWGEPWTVTVTELLGLLEEDIKTKTGLSKIKVPYHYDITHHKRAIPMAKLVGLLECLLYSDWPSSIIHFLSKILAEQQPKTTGYSSSEHLLLGASKISLKYLGPSVLMF